MDKRELWISTLIQLQSAVEYFAAMNPEFKTQNPGIMLAADNARVAWEAYMNEGAIATTDEVAL